MAKASLMGAFAIFYHMTICNQKINGHAMLKEV